MRDLEYYISQPKVDAHNHLNLGMHYEAFLAWSGEPIPDFPRRMSGLDEMHEVISRYTRPRCRTAEDVESLIRMSVRDAIADGVTVLEGSIDIGFMYHFGENMDNFLAMISSVVSDNAAKIDMRPELGFGKTFDKDKIHKWAPDLIRSGVFKSIDLYGPEIFEGIEDFKYLFELSEKLGLKKKAHVGEFSDADSVQRLVEFFDLQEIQHGIGAAQDPAVLAFLAKRKVRCNVCPQSNYMLSAVPTFEEHPVKAMLDAGVPVTIGTDDLLFFDHGCSLQIYNLVAKGVITEKDADTLLKTGV